MAKPDPNYPEDPKVLAQAIFRAADRKRSRQPEPVAKAPTRAGAAGDTGASEAPVVSEQDD